MKSTVYFATARARRWDYEHSLVARLGRMLVELDLGSRIGKDEYVAVKTHFGSQGAHRVVRPFFLRRIADAVKDAGGKPFVCDTVRVNGWDYLEIANRNGINAHSVGCPVLLADGIFGFDSVEIDAGPVLGSVRVASTIHDVPAMIVVSHAKGHIGAGYGGAIKNIAMGGVAGRHRSGEWSKARGHLHAASAKSKLIRHPDLCTLCLQCLHICPTEAISQESEELAVDDDKCWRCGRCERVCPEDAIQLEKREDDEFQAALAEAAQAVLSTFEPGKVIFLNFALEVQPECDCMPMADTPLVQDQGILGGDDVVAVEQATLDRINSAVPLPDSAAADQGLQTGQRILAETLGVDGQRHVEAAAALGVGSQQYRLVEV
ncbi:MAG: DUF362 domain-containing protein [Anaerolineae bacterium]|jgi:uncharacterized Fe-S center protein